MKTVAVITMVLFALGGTASASMSGIDLLSETHYAGGSAAGYVDAQLDGASAAESYSPPAADSQVAASASGWASYIFHDGGKEYQALGTWFSSAGDLALRVHAGPSIGMGIGMGDEYQFLRASAESTYVFRPQTSLLQIDYAGRFSNPWENFFKVQLVDTTSETFLEDFDSGDVTGNPHYLNLTKTYPVDSSRTYALTMYATGSCDSSSFAGDADLRLTVSAIPAPGALLLGGMGMVAVTRLRKRGTLGR